MNEDKNIFYRQYELSTYHVNMHSNLALPMLMNFLIETGSLHADQLGFGFQHIMKTQKTWVLSHLKIKLEEVPKYLDKIYIKTWLRGYDRIYFERNFQVLNHKQEVIGGACSNWVSIDLQTRRPVPADQVEHDVVYHPEMQALDKGIEKLPALAEKLPGKTYGVQFCDLDMNKHLTSVRYIDWLLNDYPFDYLNTHVPDQFEIQFFKENLFGQSLQVQTDKVDENTYLHRLFRLDDGVEVSRSRIAWRAMA